MAAARGAFRRSRCGRTGAVDVSTVSSTSRTHLGCDDGTGGCAPARADRPGCGGDRAGRCFDIHRGWQSRGSCRQKLSALAVAHAGCSGLSGGRDSRKISLSSLAGGFGATVRSQSFCRQRGTGRRLADGAAHGTSHHGRRGTKGLRPGQAGTARAVPGAFHGACEEDDWRGGSTACRVRSSRNRLSSTARDMADRTTRGATPASRACCQRPAQTHQRSPGLSPTKPVAGLGVIRSFPCARISSRNRRSMTAHTPCTPASCALTVQNPLRLCPAYRRVLHGNSGPPSTLRCPEGTALAGWAAAP